MSDVGGRTSDACAAGVASAVELSHPRSVVQPSVQVFESAESRRRAAAGLLGLAVALVGVYVLLRQYAPFAFEAAELRAWIRGFGVFAPLVFVLIQATQVIVAPVPGQVMALVGGYLFGPFLGTLYSMTGVLLGSAVAFSISRRYGRPAVERLLHADIIDRFDGFVERAGLPGLFLFVVIPGLPDDVVCFLAGLARFRLLSFLVVLAAGRSPAYVITTYAGGSLAEGQILQAVVAIAVIVFASALAYLKRDEIRRFAGRI
jgi:uncharacterized membrane protein YdjX (TVP38/TMEM64 family)